MKLIDPTYVRRLVPAALLAATAALGGSALGEPATASAAPKVDVAGYNKCAKVFEDAFIAGNSTAARMHEGFKECCKAFGGVFNDFTGECTDPPAKPAVAEPGVVAPPPVVATQPPPPPPVVRNPGMITPGPVSPG